MSLQGLQVRGHFITFTVFFTRSDGEVYKKVDKTLIETGMHLITCISGHICND